MQPRKLNPLVQPFRKVKIDWTNPISRGLKVCYFREKEYATNSEVVTTNGGFSIDKNGRYWFSSGDGSYLLMPDVELAYTDGGYDPLSVVALGQFSTSSSTSAICSYTNEDGGNNGWTLKAEQWADSNQVGFTKHGTVGADVTSGIATPSGFCFIGVSVSQAGHQFLVNDTQSSLVGPDLVFTGSEPKQFRLGVARGTADHLVSGDRLYLVMVWQRVLSLDELWSLRHAPYQLLKPAYEQAIGIAVAITGTLTESITAADSSSCAIVRAGSVTETVTAAELFSSVMEAGGSLSEAVAAVESIGGSVQLPVALTEAMAAADAASATAAMPVAVTETVTAAEASSITLAQPGALTEAVTASEAQTSQHAATMALSESVSSADSATASGSLVASLAEAVTAQDAVSYLVTLSTVLTETVSSADAQQTTHAAGVSVSEGVTTTDFYTTGNLITDSVTETASAGEAVTVSQVQVAFSVETASAQDSVAVIAMLQGLLTEAVAATDGQISIVTSEVQVSEPVILGDSQTTGSVISSAVAEAASSADAVLGSIVMAAGVSESVAASDVSEILGGIQVSLEEVVSLSEAQAVTLFMGGLISESVSASEVQSAGGTQSATQAETMTLQDFIQGLVGSIPRGVQRLFAGSIFPGYLKASWRPTKIRHVVTKGSINSFSLNFFAQNASGVIPQPLSWVSRVDIKLSNVFVFSQLATDIDKVITWLPDGNEVVFALGELLEAEGVREGTYQARVILYGSIHPNGLVFGANDQLLISVK